MAQVWPVDIAFVRAGACGVWFDDEKCNFLVYALDWCCVCVCFSSMSPKDSWFWTPLIASDAMD